jgi:murein DD-endopeptidase MepM/ murein hydrolase activator NlpD
MKAHEFLAEDSTKSYEIQRGDTLTKIARDNGTTVDAIMDLNRGNKAVRDQDTIYAGGTIKLPKTSSDQPDPGGQGKRKPADVTKPDDIAKIGNQEFPLTKAPGPNDDMGGKDFGIDDPDWEFPTVELGFGDPGYTPIIGNQVEKRPNGNWYYPGNPYPVRPDVARFAEKRLKDLDIVKSKDLGNQKFPMTKGPKVSSPDSGKDKKSDVKLPTRPGQVRPESRDISPIPGAYMTDRFGSPRGGRTHQGIDLHADRGTPVLAPNTGKVLDVGYGSTTGSYITLGDMQNNKTHRFMHLSKTLVDQGEIVKQGQLIAKSGDSGFSEITNKAYPPHLHWEKYIDGKPVDPSKFVELSPKP